MFSESMKKIQKNTKGQSLDGADKKGKLEDKGKNEVVGRKSSEYKRQLVERQRLKLKVYKMRERQFRRFFGMAQADKSGETGDNLLVYLERRLDNVVFRLKLALSRRHARQMVVHGHFLLNGKKVKSPSILVKEGDVISLSESSKNSAGLKQAFEKKFNSNVKVPEWLEAESGAFSGKVLKLPARSDIAIKAETSLIVELYSR